MNTFSGSACVRFGWETFKKRPWFFVGITVLVAAISGISGQFTSGYAGKTVVLIGAGFLVSFVVSLLVKMGTINVYLKAHTDAQSATFEDLWAPSRLVSFLIASVLVGAIVIVGLILLIVPGIIWTLRYSFVPYLIMDRGLNVSAALSESSRITSGHKWRLLGFFLLLALINLLGALCLLVGLLVSIPVSGLAVVRAYRTLSGQVSPKVV